jgi:hypothetical protein
VQSDDDDGGVLMRAFHFYIDDWLSSKKIARMDAAEERGYLRLLLRAASEPDCGLPDDEAELAIYSKLGDQWWKVTKEKGFRIAGKTSGQKLRECFVSKDGRLYNERLLREFDYQKSVSERRSKAAEKANLVRWSKPPNQIPNGSETVSQNDPNDVSVSVSVSQEGFLKKVGDSDFDYESGFHELWSLYPKKGRTKIVDSQRFYVETVSPDPMRLHESLVAPLRPGGKWAESEHWRRGYISSIAEYIRNRRDLEDPEPYDPAKESSRNGKVSALEAAKKSIEDVNLADVETAY